MHQTVIRLLLAALMFTTIAVAGTGCTSDEPEAGSAKGPGPSEKASDILGDDQEVIAACQSACARMTEGELCTSKQRLMQDSEACKAGCAEQIHGVAKSCRDEALMNYDCAAEAKWTCANSSEVKLADQECAIVISMYRACLGGR